MNGYLDGSLLVATPNVTGDIFQHSVIWMCAHSAEGAMGVIINRPLEHVKTSDLFAQVNLPAEKLKANPPVFYGGPVEVNRGFVLYDAQPRFAAEAMLEIGGIAISGSLGVLRAMAEGQGPVRNLLALGYCGWAPGQLESEMEDNSWISVPLDKDLLFVPHNAQKWERAALLQGVDLRKLSTVVGHA
jgi:putative transcriptional regulator